jgi:hypothetical protein
MRICAINSLKMYMLTFSVMAVDAIIFLAPISGFDQVLAEDKTINRLVSHFNLAYAAVSHIYDRKTPYYYGKQFVRVNCLLMWIWCFS